MDHNLNIWTVKTFYYILDIVLIMRSCYTGSNSQLLMKVLRIRHEFLVWKWMEDGFAIKLINLAIEARAKKILLNNFE